MCLIYIAEANDNCLLPTTVDDAIAYANMIVAENSSIVIHNEHFEGHWYYGTIREFHGIFVDSPGYILYSTAGTVEQKISPLHPDLVAAGFRRPFLQECLVNTTLAPSSRPTWLPPTMAPSSSPTLSPSSSPAISPTTTPTWWHPTMNPSIIPTLAPSTLPTINTSVIPKPPYTNTPSLSPTFVSSTSSTTTTSYENILGMTPSMGPTTLATFDDEITQGTTTKITPETTPKTKFSGSTLESEEENSIATSIGICLLGLLVIAVILFIAKSRLRKKKAATVVNQNSKPPGTSFEPLYSMPQRKIGGTDVFYETIDDCLGRGHHYEKAVTQNPAYTEGSGSTQGQYDIANIPLERNEDYGTSVFSVDEIYDKASNQQNASEGHYDMATMPDEEHYDLATLPVEQKIKILSGEQHYDTATMMNEKEPHDYRTIHEINYETGI